MNDTAIEEKVADVQQTAKTSPQVEEATQAAPDVSVPLEDVLLRTKKQRRILNYVPKGEDTVRQGRDRRGGLDENESKYTPSHSLPVHEGVRYIAVFEVRVTCHKDKGRKEQFVCKTEDISTTGILLNINQEQMTLMAEARKLELKFKIPPGVMPEGYERTVKIDANIVRKQELDTGGFHCGLIFEPSLARYIYSHKSVNISVISFIMMMILVVVILLMRTESVMYFRFNRLLYSYSIMTAFYLLSRYLLGALYKPVPINEEFTPSVTIIIPCFNEEEWIQRTIISCVDQDYPAEQVEIIVVDDCSNDNSMAKIEEVIQRLWTEGAGYHTKGRVSCVQMPKNGGKREALSMGVKLASSDLVVFVDSDSFLDQLAIRNLVQPFQDPKMGGVTGRTDVANTYTNALTKMQSVRYYIAFRVMKAAESYFDAVTCLSGPISCYRRSIVVENMDNWLNQSFLGQRATFGDDRAMTNFVLRHHRTYYQDTAMCSTIVPNQHRQFLKQQMRWKRSWLRETMTACTFVWKKEPLMAILFYMGFIIPLIAPAVVIYNLIIVPITQQVFPLAFLIGLVAMALLMSAAQLFFRRSSTWIYGFLFCIYYVGILLWQMPIAVCTFWVSTWGTRMTPEDIKAAEAKKRRKEERQAKKVRKNNARQ